MDENLNKKDIDIIIESLVWSRDKVTEGDNEPSYEAKMQRVKPIEEVLFKVRKLKKDWIE